MATPKKNTKAPEAATVAEGEGVKAPVVAVETGATAGEQGSSAPNTEGADAASDLKAIDADTAEQAAAEAKAAELAAAEAAQAAANIEAASKQAEIDQAAHDARVAEARAAMAQADADERAKVQANAFKDPEIIEVRVIGPDAGRWRITAAPRHFTPEPTFIPYADLTEADLMELQADTELKVTLITNGPVLTA